MNESAYIQFFGRATDHTNDTEEELTLSQISSYNSLVTGNFQLSENDTDISESESYPVLTPLNYTQSYYSLVILIDTSSSMSEADLTKSKTAALALITKPDGTSRIKPNQTVSIVTFDNEVDPQTIKPTNDFAKLTEQIEAITVSANSSSMNCSVLQTLPLWDDSILVLELVSIKITNE